MNSLVVSRQPRMSNDDESDITTVLYTMPSPSYRCGLLMQDKMCVILCRLRVAKVLPAAGEIPDIASSCPTANWLPSQIFPGTISCMQVLSNNFKCSLCSASSLSAADFLDDLLPIFNCGALYGLRKCLKNAQKRTLSHDSESN